MWASLFVIEGIAGENSGGAIVYSGKQVAYMNNYANNVWHLVALAPFVIEGIAGNKETARGKCLAV